MHGEAIQNAFQNLKPFFEEDMGEKYCIARSRVQPEASLSIETGVGGRGEESTPPEAGRGGGGRGAFSPPLERRGVSYKNRIIIQIKKLDNLQKKLQYEHFLPSRKTNNLDYSIPPSFNFSYFDFEQFRSKGF